MTTRRGRPQKKQSFAHKGGAFGPRGTTLEGEWLLLAEACGNNGLLAAEIGVTYNTLRRWQRGDTEIPESSKKLIRYVSASKGVKSPV